MEKKKINGNQHKWFKENKSRIVTGKYLRQSQKWIIVLIQNDYMSNTSQRILA